MDLVKVSEMNPRYRPGLTVSILAFLGFLLLLTWLLFSILAFKTAANDLYTQKGEYARTLLKVFVTLLPDYLPTYPEGFILSDSPASLYADKLLEESGFNRMTLLDKNGKPVFTKGRDESDAYSPFQWLSPQAEGSYIKPDGSEVVHIISIKRDGNYVGKAGLLLSLAPERARLNRSKQMLFAYFILDFILLLGLGSFILSRIVVIPINRLLGATEKITDGQYGQPLTTSGTAELSQLAKAFNKMATALNNKDIKVAEQLAALTRMNNDLRLAREETLRTEKMASIGLLAAGMAHEIGTPLASIMGYAELVVGEQPENLAIQDYAHRISQDSLRIDRIVRGLLDFSRPRTGSGESTDINSVINYTVELLTQQGVFKYLHLNIDVVDNGLLFARCDQYQLQQVLINILLNSRDATPDKGSITLKAKQEESYIRMEIIDNGSGITEDDMKHIFDPFFTTKPPGKGTGLGLAISARIIEGFGGHIKVFSEVGKGSNFTLWLPLADVNQGAKL